MPPIIKPDKYFIRPLNDMRDSKCWGEEVRKYADGRIMVKTKKGVWLYNRNELISQSEYPDYLMMRKAVIVFLILLILLIVWGILSW
jgi:hypothetical protein